MSPGVAEGSVGRLLDQVADPGGGPAGGSVAAVVVGLAAGLCALTAALTDAGEAADLRARAERLRARVAPLADADVDAYAAVLAAAAAGKERALSRAADVPLAVAEAGAEVAAIARPLVDLAKPALRGDARTAHLLAEAATRAAADLVEINLAGRDDPRRDRARELAAAARLSRRAPFGGG